MTKKQSTYMNAAGIEKAIKGRGAKLDADIQTAGLSIINHVAEHGDTTLADRLFDAMPKGSRRVMLAEWFVAFGMIRTLDKKVAEDKAALDASRGPSNFQRAPKTQHSQNEFNVTKNK